MLAKMKFDGLIAAVSACSDLIDWGIPVRKVLTNDEWSLLIDQTNLTPLQQKNLELTYGVEWCKISIDDVKLREEW